MRLSKAFLTPLSMGLLVGLAGLTLEPSVVYEAWCSQRRRKALQPPRAWTRARM
jgi:hypothetical protein